MSDAGTVDAPDVDRRLSHAGTMLLIAGFAALVAALAGAASGEPTTVVLLANLAGVVGVGAAALEYTGRRDPAARTHVSVALPCVVGALFALRAGLVLTAALLVVIAGVSLEPVVSAWRDGE